MTLIDELDLDILKMNPRIKHKASRSRLSKVREQTDTHTRTHRRTDRLYRTHYQQHSWVVNISIHSGDTKVNGRTDGLARG